MKATAGPLQYQIITFYEFKDLTAVGPLVELKALLQNVMMESDVLGTIILAPEGFNSTICGTPDAVSMFVDRAEILLVAKFNFKSSFHDELPHRKVDVKIRPEIVTLKKPVDIGLGKDTHVDAAKWNEIISDGDTLILDARNDYEFRNGTFRGAINPSTAKFSELPEFVERNLDPLRHRNIAMFCTGGIRCEKFAPYMKGLGFENIYQLNGGILRYLEEVSPDESLWEGECFVFDDRRTVDQNLKRGVGPDYSLETHDVSDEK
ncbi:MAG: rhodanese-like domain-containing protein [Acidobacteriota bacterium]